MAGEKIESARFEACVWYSVIGFPDNFVLEFRAGGAARRYAIRRADLAVLAAELTRAAESQRPDLGDAENSKGVLQ